MDRSTDALAIRVREHWEKWLPKKTKELKDTGQFYKATQIVAVYAQAEIADLMAKGCPEHTAEEAVLSLLIMLEPEQHENWAEGSRLGWTEPISVHLHPELDAALSRRR